MENHPKMGAMCVECHAPLDARGRCLACLLRGGLPEETLAGSAPATQTDVRSADTVYGDFEITCRDDGSFWELGRGAMGVTYRAVDRVLHRDVALKVVQLGESRTQGDGQAEAMRERFLREARAAAALRHTTIAGVFQYGVTPGSRRCYYAMELVEGEALEERVRREGPLDVDITLEVARQVTAALVAAAARGLIHRDLKPTNLMLSGGGNGDATAPLEVKVIDFGLAKAVAATDDSNLTNGGFVGTPAFASPEQFTRVPIDARADIYSLGVTLWYALTGLTPFAGTNSREFRTHPARGDLPLDQLTARRVPRRFVALLRDMLAEDPAHRPASARELATALERCRQPRANRAFGGARKPWSVRLIAAWAVAMVALTVVALGWWETFRPRQSPTVQSGRGPATAAPPATHVKSVAVLPFDNFSEDKDSAFFADGVQDAVLTNLSHVADLKVISRSSVMRYKASGTRNLREIGKTLDVAYLVEGNVQRSGDHIRVMIQLIDARTDSHLWAEKYDRPLGDVFAIQSEIAQAIAGKLQAVISPQEYAAMTELPTRDETAYELYLRARAIWDDFDKFTNNRELCHTVLDLLQRATARDPHFVHALTLTTLVRCTVFRSVERNPANAAAARDRGAAAAGFHGGQHGDGV